MRKHFLTGLAILLPFAVTLFVVVFIVNFLTSPFLGIVEAILNYYHLQHSFLFFSEKEVLHVISKILVLITLFLVTLIIGFLGRLVLVNYLFRIGDVIIQRIPFVNKIYKAAQETVKTVFSSEKTAFSHVVLVPFPHNKSFSIGLITRNTREGKAQDEISIFVPGTPNPTIGFMLTFRRDQLIFIDMKVEDAIKFIVSCGVMFTSFSKVRVTENFHDISAK
jgi:uncharacterized membrane protein